MSEISIAIPAHDRGENGPKWMRELLDSLKQQTFQDFDVVVSDQSKNDNIMNACKEYDFDFTYVKYQGSIPCENINVALSECTGRIIKIMFSDDPEWCHEQDFFAGDRFLVSDSGDNITDMCLMSMCQYHIMANSTYSWWGAWLSNSKDVIAPKLWFGPDGQDPKDVYVDRWEYLDV